MAEVTEEYKQLQRELQKARDKNKGDLEGILAAVKRLEDFVYRDSDDDDANVTETFQTRRQAEEEALTKRAAIGDLLDEHEADWTDPRLEQARKVWDAGDYAGAERAVKEALSGGGGTSTSDIDSLVAARVQEALRSRGLGDTSEGGAGGAQVPGDLGKVRELMDDPKWWKEHKQEVMADLKSGKLKV